MARILLMRGEPWRDEYQAWLDDQARIMREEAESRVITMWCGLCSEYVTIPHVITDCEVDA